MDNYNALPHHLQKFVFDYYKTRKPTKCYLENGYWGTTNKQTARCASYGVLQRPKVKAALQEIAQEFTNKLKLERDEYIALVVENAFEQIHNGADRDKNTALKLLGDVTGYNAPQQTVILETNTTDEYKEAINKLSAFATRTKNKGD